MNLNDFRTRAARVSGMSTSDSGDLALLDSWANEGVVQFLKDTKIHKRTASLAVTAGTSDYELDTDILSFVDVWMEPANSSDLSRLLERRDGADIRQMRLYDDATDVSVMYYGLDGANFLLLYPAPLSSSDTLHISYVPRPSSSLSVTSDSPSSTAYGGIPSEFHPLVEAYVKWKACEAEEHRPSENGLQFQSEWERGIAKVKADMNRKSGVMAAPAQWGRRPKRIPSSPGIDLG